LAETVGQKDGNLGQKCEIWNQKYCEGSKLEDNKIELA
jgi:hypothetical protein